MLLATRKIVTPVLGNSLFNNNKEECCLVSFPAEEYRTAEKGKMKIYATLKATLRGANMRRAQKGQVS